MAYLSVGETNDELIEKMLAHGVLDDGSKILEAFRVTDRGDFVPQTHRLEAYTDRPFKRDFVHISAPHMYVTVLEHLELQPGMSFLNIGSGSGYFSCLAACMLGDGGLSHGIDIDANVVRHSQECCERWFKGVLARREAGEVGLPTISREGVALVHGAIPISLAFVFTLTCRTPFSPHPSLTPLALIAAGNCFDIDVAVAVSSCRYDRIYVGAGCPADKKEFFFSLLSDTGIMVVLTRPLSSPYLISTNLFLAPICILLQVSNY